MVKIIQPVQIQTAVSDDVMAVKIPKELTTWGETDFNFFIDLKEIENLGIEELNLKTLKQSRDFRHYVYYDGKLGHLIDSMISLSDSSEQDKFWDLFESICAQDSVELIKQKSFNSKNLIYLWNDSHLFYRFRETMPLTRPYHVDYIGGVTNEYYDLDKAEKILKKNKWVSKITRIKIPHYNRDKNTTHAVEFMVRLPQTVHDKLVKYYRDELKEKYWSVKVKDALATAYSLEPFDVLGLKPALKNGF